MSFTRKVYLRGKTLPAAAHIEGDWREPRLFVSVVFAFAGERICAGAAQQQLLLCFDDIRPQPPSLPAWTAVSPGIPQAFMPNWDFRSTQTQGLNDDGVLNLSGVKAAIVGLADLLHITNAINPFTTHPVYWFCSFSESWLRHSLVSLVLKLLDLLLLLLLVF